MFTQRTRECSGIEATVFLIGNNRARWGQGEASFKAESREESKCNVEIVRR
jgi:hypothetical protein